MPEPSVDPRLERLVAAILPHVPFDGWGEAAFRAAAEDAGIPPEEARMLCPRGGLDLAVAHHRLGDRALARELGSADLSGMRFRDRIAHAVRRRLELEGDREVVRRASALFALPLHAGEGARLMWETADTIWNALGDPSRDVNWYTKRLTLAGVISATVLYWLGDETPGFAATWEFLDRRIEDVMRIEKVKAAVRNGPFSGLADALGRALSGIRPPAAPPDDLPGPRAPRNP